MTLVHNLVQDQELDNDELMDIFKCGSQGGMRKSNKTNTLILIHDPDAKPYNDEWIGNVLHYTGAGLIGDQKLTHQNKILLESKNTKIDVYLFERVYKELIYRYKGKVELSGEHYQKNNLIKITRCVVYGSFH